MGEKFFITTTQGKDLGIIEVEKETRSGSDLSEKALLSKARNVVRRRFPSRRIVRNKTSRRGSVIGFVLSAPRTRSTRKRPTRNRRAVKKVKRTSRRTSNRLF